MLVAISKICLSLKGKIERVQRSSFYSLVHFHPPSAISVKNLSGKTKKVERKVWDKVYLPLPGDPFLSLLKMFLLPIQNDRSETGVTKWTGKTGNEISHPESFSHPKCSLMVSQFCRVRFTITGNSGVASIRLRVPLLLPTHMVGFLPPQSRVKITLLSPVERRRARLSCEWGFT